MVAGDASSSLHKKGKLQQQNHYMVALFYDCQNLCLRANMPSVGPRGRCSRFRHNSCMRISQHPIILWADRITNTYSTQQPYLLASKALSIVSLRSSEMGLDFGRPLPAGRGPDQTAPHLLDPQEDSSHLLSAQPGISPAPRSGRGALPRAGAPPPNAPAANTRSRRAAKHAAPGHPAATSPAPSLLLLLPQQLQQRILVAAGEPVAPASACRALRDAWRGIASSPQLLASFLLARHGADDCLLRLQAHAHRLARAAAPAVAAPAGARGAGDAAAAASGSMSTAAITTGGNAVGTLWAPATAVCTAIPHHPQPASAAGAAGLGAADPFLDVDSTSAELLGCLWEQGAHVAAHAPWLLMTAAAAGHVRTAARLLPAGAWGAVEPLAEAMGAGAVGVGGGGVAGAGGGGSGGRVEVGEGDEVSGEDDSEDDSDFGSGDGSEDESGDGSEDNSGELYDGDSSSGDEEDGPGAQRAREARAKHRLLLVQEACGAAAAAAAAAAAIPVAAAAAASVILPGFGSRPGAASAVRAAADLKRAVNMSFSLLEEVGAGVAAPLVCWCGLEMAAAAGHVGVVQLLLSCCRYKGSGVEGSSSGVGGEEGAGLGTNLCELEDWCIDSAVCAAAREGRMPVLLLLLQLLARRPTGAQEQLLATHVRQRASGAGASGGARRTSPGGQQAHVLAAPAFLTAPAMHPGVTVAGASEAAQEAATAASAAARGLLRLASKRASESELLGTTAAAAASAITNGGGGGSSRTSGSGSSSVQERVARARRQKRQKHLDKAVVEASRMGHAGCVLALLAAGASPLASRGSDPHVPDTSGSQGSALAMAAAAGHLGCVLALLVPKAQTSTRAAAPVAAAAALGGQALLAAVTHGHVAVAEALLAAGTDPGSMHAGEALVAAVRHAPPKAGTAWSRGMEAAAVLLRWGVSPSRAALLAACGCGNAPAMSLLLRAGADVSDQRRPVRRGQAQVQVRGQLGGDVAGAGSVSAGPVGPAGGDAAVGEERPAKRRRMGGSGGEAPGGTSGGRGESGGAVESAEVEAEEADEEAEALNAGELLLAACRAASAETVEVLLAEGGVDPCARGGLPLVAAAAARSAAICRTLLAAGADANARGGQPLMAAVCVGSPELVRLLLGAGASAGGPAGAAGLVTGGRVGGCGAGEGAAGAGVGGAVAVAAAASGSAGAASGSAGAASGSAGAGKGTAKDVHAERQRELLDVLKATRWGPYNGDPYNVDSGPLVAACGAAAAEAAAVSPAAAGTAATRAVEVVRLLLAAGADPNVASGLPLRLACGGSGGRGVCMATAEALLAAGADAAASDSQALACAARAGSLPVVQLLLSYGAKAGGGGGARALVHAAREGRVDLAGVLLAAGAEAGAEAEWVAQQGGHEVVLQMLWGSVSFLYE